MRVQVLPWHRSWLAQARALVAARHHAWLIVGRAGDGVAEAATALAASVLCSAPVEGAPCGTCPSCRWLAVDAHPDFRALVPDEGDGETVKLPTIKIEPVREALDFMQLSSDGAAGRVLLINPATALSRDSGNAILKGLEEPPANTRWLLVAAQRARLLPTLRSRCLQLAPPRPSSEAARAWLGEQGVAADAIPALLRQARGAPLTALMLAGSEAARAVSDLIEDLQQPRRSWTLKWGAWLDSGAKVDRRERFALMLTVLLDWTADWARVRAAQPPAVHVERRAALAQLAPGLPLAEGLRYHRDLLRKLHLPDTTLSARLQFEAVLLDYRALFSR